MIVCSKSTGERGRRVAVDKHKIGAFLLEYLIDAKHGARSDVEKRLTRRHDIEVIVGHDAEEMQHLIEHLAVLCRDKRPRFDFVRMTHELPDDGRHLDRLGTCTKNRHDFDFACHYACAPLCEANL